MGLVISLPKALCGLSPKPWAVVGTSCFKCDWFIESQNHRMVWVGRDL